MKKIESYYENNKNKIKSTIGISNIDNFKKLYEYSSSQGKLNNINFASIDTDSFEQNKKYLSFNMTLIFDENKEFSFDVNFMNNKTSKGVVKYKCY